jgi:hypothetical protein
MASLELRVARAELTVDFPEASGAVVVGVYSVEQGQPTNA